METIEHLLNLAIYPDILLGDLAGCHRNVALQHTSLESLGHSFNDNIMVARETQLLLRRNLKSIF